ncbi:hypothetical protein CROQUDRAFT_41437 [Cronartium quercuum f. sp. fusiforme G11]|uniref:cAMP-dependent protein kinase n=1 Tax=Cronartium quercuum f. sp. fusiforme G11 TaxID=708437 RepID=A0A9P6NM32_9BASI|nr:hypothetical protein CROQUDRAFT_41437 [Cronartium quercuum f. sp. fusiforme G11]
MEHTLSNLNSEHTDSDTQNFSDSHADCSHSPSTEYSTSSFPNPSAPKKTIPRRFAIYKGLGQGSFGQVLLASNADRDSQLGKLVALKLVKKKCLKKPQHIQHVKDEKDVLCRLPAHPHILKLWETMSDKHFLYLNMEYFPGGDMWQLMNSFGRPFTEEEAKFYSAQIASGLHHLHKHDIIYRDLKPDNIVIRANGHVALCDFGFAKHVRRQDGRTRTICGSIEFMAPEIFQGHPYTSAVDWWAFGALVYNFLVYAPPFDFSLDSIRRGIYGFPVDNTYSASLRILIAGLLQKEPDRRSKGEKVCTHPWITSAKHNSPPPWVPVPILRPPNAEVYINITNRGPNFEYEEGDLFAGF